MGKILPLLQKYWLLPCLLLAGYGGNYFRLHLFFGVDFLFGSIATLLVIVYFGLFWGLISAAIAGSYTLLIWHHGYALVVILLEALVVAIMLRQKQRNLVLLNSLFWLLIGMPLVYIFYHWGLNMTPVPARLVTLKQATNGIFNSLIASFLITSFGLTNVTLPVLLKPTYPRWQRLSFEQTLFNLLVAFIFFPLLFVTVFNGQESFLEMEKQMAENLTSLSIPVQNSIQDWYQNHLRGAEIFSEQILPLLTEVNRGNDEQLFFLSLETETTQKAFDGFSYIYIGDRQGKIIASSPEFNEVGQSRLGLIQSQKVANFSLAQPGMKISPLHRTSLDIKPHISITIPLMNDNGLQGFVNASLNLSKAENLLYADRVNDQLSITLTDGKNQVVASTIANLLPLEVYQPFQAGEIRNLDENTYHWYPDQPANPTLRWRNSYYYHISSLENINGWQLIIGLPAQESVEQLQSHSVQKLGLLLCLTLIGLVIAIGISKRVAKPLLTLAKITTDIPAKLQYQGLTPVALHSEVSEVVTLNENFNEMLTTLQNQFKTIKQARDNLEVRVAERTNTLIAINKQLAGEIEERQHIEIELRKAKENAEFANRFKSEFLANISHEIRTPMNAILGFCDLLLQKNISPAQTESYLNAINSSSKVLLVLIDDILDISKIEAGKLIINEEPVNLKSTLVEIKQIFDYTAENKGIILITQLDASLSQEIYFDAVRLRQILFNLVGNAIKFTDTGQVFVYIGVEDTHIQKSDQYVSLAIEVTDTGIGIAPEDQSRIFDVFTQSQGQSTRKYGGTGLGLTITKRLTALLGGSISLQSQPGEGSTFILRFPSVRLVENSVSVDGDRLGLTGQLNIAEQSKSSIPAESFPESIDNALLTQPTAVPLLTPGQREQLISLLTEQENEIWQSLRHTLISRQLRNFGDRLRKLGKEHHWDGLEAYGHEIIKALENFDSRHLEKLMGEFPQYRASLMEIPPITPTERV
ncbi:MULTISPECIES: hybrid sensor histidine kinase/response regulator [unclassified Synechocystis]|uniref:sensor histidine kinase n=1 Tax=unclassified Synechocystis TaxID=2640012 RepID=UPI0004235C0A|nr:MULTISPECIES: hybrid sensor histidine kinase/response regulator [unclassified Synechocystis]AIE73594.1 two-component sensor histidine kinase [Synechocystis sp. PCC 6714]MCT0254960.1 histidine kinase [Synechocystis sp. CS-94]